MSASRSRFARSCSVLVVTACVLSLSSGPAQAIGGTGEKASASPIAVRAGSADMTMTILGVVDVPVETTLVPFTDLKLSRSIPDPASYVALAAKPTLTSGVYKTGTRTHPFLAACNRAEVFDAGQTASVQTWGASGLTYPADAVTLTAGGTCGPVGHGITQRAQWGSGSGTAQMLTSYSSALGVEVAAPGSLVDELPERTMLTADALTSRAACPSLSTMAPAGALSIKDLAILGGALRLGVSSSGVLTSVVTADGTSLPLETAFDVDTGVPGLLVDTWYGIGLGRFTVDLQRDDIEQLFTGTSAVVLDGAIGVDARLVIELDARKATSTSGGWATASAAALEAEIRVEIELEDESYLSITNVAETGPGRIILANLTLAESSCSWRRGAASSPTWLDPTLT